MNFLYAYRGWILGLLAVAMVALPGAAVTDRWLYESLPMTVACLVIFAVVRICARRSIGEHTRGFTHDADRLVTEGVYSRIRHPLYLSNGGIGYALVIFHFGFDVIALPFVITLFVFEFLLSRMEDRFLENRFQDEWRKWAAVTPAFLPKLSCTKLPADRKCTCVRARSFVAAFKADFSTWFWLAVAVAVIFARKWVG